MDIFNTKWVDCLGILSKDNGEKRNASIMVRMPSNLTLIIDQCVGISHSSRPDFVTDGVRSFIHYIITEEDAVMKYLKEKEDASREVKLQFYYESMKNKTEMFRKAVVSAAEKSTKKDVDILLSLPRGLASQIDGVVNRTKCFRNHQEFVKAATVYLTTQMGTDNTNELDVLNFLESNQATKDLQEQIEKMRKEMDESH